MAVRPRGTAVFVGCARSCSPHLNGVLANVTALAATYERTALVVFENDSSDDTAARLAAYAAARADAFVLSEPGLAAAISSRTKRLAHGRNACLEFVRNAPYRDFDELVVLDFDQVNRQPISVDRFIDARKHLEARIQLHGVFANAQPIYYDLWALRQDPWCPGDCWADARAAGGADANDDFVYSRMVPVPPEAAPIEVFSAFGGLGVYKLAAALTGEYSDPTSSKFGQSEHVAFHHSMRERCASRFEIFPSLTNQTPWEHVLGGSSSRLKLQPLTQNDRSCAVVVPSDHQLGAYRANHPLYDQRLPALARIVSQAAPGSTMVDVGANVGDNVTLCRLAGCDLPIVAVEASLTYFKLLQLNAQRNRPLFRPLEAHWAFVGKAEDQSPLRLQGGTASVIATSARPARLTLDRAPVVSLADICRGDISLIKTDVDGYDQVIIANDFAFLERTEPIIWCEAQSETVEADEQWRDLIDRMTRQWPYVMAFDNFGFCLLSGSTADHAATCATLIASTRRYRRAEASRIIPSARLYYLDLAFFPARYEAVFRTFEASLAELTL
jgi:FkbM family methyltransferase